MPRKYKKHTPIKVGVTRERLTVVVGPIRENGRTRWTCNCTCGTNGIQVGDTALKSGHTRSCGCLRREAVAAQGHAKRTHGESLNSVEYRTWADIKRRTSSENRDDYQRYGGKGITLCAGWRASFPLFLKKVGRRPSTKHSIDRVRNEGGYWCGECDECVKFQRSFNCRWATAIEQAQNKSNNLHLTIDGITHCQREWERVEDLPFGIIYARLKAGWSINRSLLKPPRKTSRSNQPDRFKFNLKTNNNSV